MRLKRIYALLHEQASLKADVTLTHMEYLRTAVRDTLDSLTQNFKPLRANRHLVVPSLGTLQSVLLRELVVRTKLRIGAALENGHECLVIETSHASQFHLGR